jgi:hypothetical protein
MGMERDEKEERAELRGWKLALHVFRNQIQMAVIFQ